MKCAIIQKSLSAYLDREVHLWEKQNIVLHLEQCDACQSDVRDLLEMKQGVRAQPMPAMPDAVRQIIEQETILKISPWKQWVHSWWWVPTVAFAIGIMGWFVFRGNTLPAPQSTPPQMVMHPAPTPDRTAH